jgi:iron-sulfur cluster assembly accessory protein
MLTTMADENSNTAFPVAVTLRMSPRAIQQVKLLLQKQSGAEQALRVWVADGGCSGFSYKLAFANEAKPGDIVVEMDGLPVYVDSASLPHLQGTLIDYADGLYGGGFKFTNPNASATCGCGTSFSAQ